ncbi:MAG: hypothetical protein RR361_08355, partial [Anaerovorax sp.]
MSQDRYLEALYDSLHDSPMQRKFKRICPWPCGVVFIEWPNMSEEDIRNQFRLMKRLGFNALKQVMTQPTTDRRRVMNLALDEGLIPWWYGEGGWENPTPELLRELGINESISIEDLRQNKRWLNRQDSLMRKRIESETPYESPTNYEKTQPHNNLPGVVKRYEYGIEPEFASLFTQFLKDTYQTVDALKSAWHFGVTMIHFRDWKTWEDVEKEAIPVVNAEGQEYGRIRDCIRFKTVLLLGEIKRQALAQLESDQNAPFRSGGEISLFLPMPNLCVDMEAIADMLTEIGSYYPSIH